MYFPGDGYSGRIKADGSLFTKNDSHIAHRTIPLGTAGIMCNVRTKLCTKTSVRDRGPYGAIMPCTEDKPDPLRIRGRSFKVFRILWRSKCYWWQAQPRKLRKGFSYRGAFDVSKPVAAKIRMKHFDPVVFIYGEI
jgi:hypothetical protein